MFSLAETALVGASFVSSRPLMSTLLHVGNCASSSQDVQDVVSVFAPKGMAPRRKESSILFEFNTDVQASLALQVWVLCSFVCISACFSVPACMDACVCVCV